ncbi:MAG: hypothetical protein RLZZ165_1193 [Bacteroidota bacterium]|jgi:hypothetical protein
MDFFDLCSFHKPFYSNRVQFSVTIFTIQRGFQKNFCNTSSLESFQILLDTQSVSFHPAIGAWMAPPVGLMSGMEMGCPSFLVRPIPWACSADACGRMNPPACRAMPPWGNSPPASLAEVLLEYRRMKADDSSKFVPMDRRKRLLNRVLLVSGGSAVLLFAGYVFFTHRAAHHYYLPTGFSGWVTVKFEKPHAPPIPEMDGVLVFRVPVSGILETSSRLKTGWSRDEFYREGSSVPLPKQVDCGTESCRWVHDLKESPMDYSHSILALPEAADTLLWDGARISKKGGHAEVRTGRKTMLHFYVSAQPQPFFHSHDSLPPALKEW